MRKLRNVLDKALTASADGCAVETFEEALPRQARADAKLLAALRDEALTAVRENTEVGAHATQGVCCACVLVFTCCSEAKLPPSSAMWRLSPTSAPPARTPPRRCRRCSSQREFEDMCAERGVVSKLNALDDLIAEMPTGGGEWRVPQ